MKEQPKGTHPSILKSQTQTSTFFLQGKGWQTQLKSMKHVSDKKVHGMITKWVIQHGEQTQYIRRHIYEGTTSFSHKFMWI